jgi:transposase-like protein
MELNLASVIREFSTEEKCIAFLIRQRWNGQPTCPYCNSTKSYVIEGGKRFKCADKTCHKKYSVTVGTIFHASNIPLITWFPAMYLISAHKKGISSVQLAKDLGVTQKTAWFMLHRIRKSLKEKNSPLLQGVVEVDETYMGRKYKSDFVGLSPEEVEKLVELQPTKNTKGAVIGMVERGGKVIAKAANAINKENVVAAITENVDRKATLMTDDSKLYRNREIRKYRREYVQHSKKQWVDGNCHTNTIEGFWAVMKRGIHGIYHQISAKHLQRYCDEFSYRYNSRDIKDGARFELVSQRINGHLSYKQLVNGKGK